MKETLALSQPIHTSNPLEDYSVNPNTSTEDILKNLIAMPTITGDYAVCHQAFDYIETFLAGHGLYVTRHEWNGVESLVATTHKTKTPSVFLMGHIDVVPAEPHMFALQVTADTYVGRGVLDMKGAIAAYLGAVRELGEQVADYDFGLMFTSDEEVSGYDGARNLAEEGYLPKVMVIMDGGGNWNIEQYAKGIWHPTLESTGISAHGSRPWEGKNAIDNLMDALHEVKQLFTNQSPEGSTINIGTFNGGNATNQIPALASASVDMRFASAEEQDRITHQVHEIARKYGLTVHATVRSDSVTTDPQNQYIAAFAATVEQVIKHPIQWVTSNAGNDGRYFASKGVQCAVTYPRGGGHHGSEEWIGKETLDQMQRIFVSYIKEVGRV